MDTSLDHCALIAADSAALADAAEANLGAPVEHCPGWTVADLVRHVRHVHWFWGTIVERKLEDPEQVGTAPEPAEADLIEAFRRGAFRLVEILGAADPTTPVWTWSSQHDAGFVIRHQVQEAAVHRWDAQHAAGCETPIDPAAAADAVDEFLTFSLPEPGDPNRESQQLLAADLILATTDTGQAWTIRDGAVHGTLTAAPGTGDGVRIEATASDLLLWLYRRIDLPASGPDATAVLERFRALTSSG